MHTSIVLTNVKYISLVAAIQLRERERERERGRHIQLAWRFKDFGPVRFHFAARNET